MERPSSWAGGGYEEDEAAGGKTTHPSRLSLTLQVGNMLIVFGGQLSKDGSTTNDLFWMTIDRMEWHLQPAKGDKPQARWGCVRVLGGHREQQPCRKGVSVCVRAYVHACVRARVQNLPNFQVSKQ